MSSSVTNSPSDSPELFSQLQDPSAMDVLNGHVTVTPRIPSVFTFGHPMCQGDMILETLDATPLCVSKAILANASVDLRSQVTVPNLPTERHSGLPHMILEEDLDVVLVVLQAIYPLPLIPITTSNLGLKVVTVANRFGLHPTLFRLDSAVQAEGAIIHDPLGTCALGWSIGDQAVLEKASRFTHKIPAHTLVDRAWQIPNGFEVLSAILATRLARGQAIEGVLSSLLRPGGPTCESCLTRCRIALIDFFDQPFPDTSRLLKDCGPILWGFHLTVCESCGRSREKVRTQSMSYTDGELAEVKASLARVPQAILPWVFEEKLARIQRSARSSWGTHL